MRLPADDRGRGPVVVLLHARPADRTMWRAAVPLLVDAGHRVVALDLPGHGEAPGTDPEDDHGEAAPWRDVLETLTGLGVGRCVLVGNSLGALVALQAAVTAPERVDGLVLVGYRPHDQPASAALQAAWDGERAALASGDLEAAVDAGVRAWTAPAAPAAVTEHAARMLRRNLQRQLTTGGVRQAEDPLGRGSAALGALAVPAAVGVGELDMPDFFRGGEDLAAALGAGGLFVIPSAAHLAPLEQPVLFCQQVVGFLSTLPGPAR